MFLAPANLEEEVAVASQLPPTFSGRALRCTQNYLLIEGWNFGIWLKVEPLGCVSNTELV